MHHCLSPSLGGTLITATSFASLSFAAFKAVRNTQHEREALGKGRSLRGFSLYNVTPQNNVHTNMSVCLALH
eukprot:1138229-Pelagomonas_calceolata.AAC.6